MKTASQTAETTRKAKEKADENTVTLRITDDPKSPTGIRIGPSKRMMWWSVWDGKAKEQWSP
jgi:hypothetical protein